MLHVYVYCHWKTKYNPIKPGKILCKSALDASCPLIKLNSDVRAFWVPSSMIVNLSKHISKKTNKFTELSPNPSTGHGILVWSFIGHVISVTVFPCSISTEK